MTRRPFLLLGFLGIFGALALIGLPSTEGELSGTVLVYVPAELEHPWFALKERLADAHPRLEVKEVVAPRRKLIERVLAGETPDLFLTVGDQELTPLDRADKLVPGSFVRAATAPLVLVTSTANPQGIHSLGDLDRSGQVRLATGNPKGCTAAYVAREVLKRRGLLKSSGLKLRTGSGLSEMVSWLEKGDVDAAILCRSCLKLPGVRSASIREICPVPPGAAGDVPVGGVLLRGCMNAESARGLLKWLGSAGNQTVWNEWGYESLGGRNETEQDGLFIYCAAGLRRPMQEIAERFTQEYGIRVRLTYTGSACLLAQITMTEMGDLYLPGEAFYMEQARQRGFISESAPVAYFVPVFMFRKKFLRGRTVRGFQDLVALQPRLGVGETRTCAVGLMTRRLFQKNDVRQALETLTLMHTATAPELGNAVQLGTVDAAINWDAVAGWYGETVDVVAIPEGENLFTPCPLGILKWTRHPQAARVFLRYVKGPTGRAIFKSHHYTVDPHHPVFPAQKPVRAP